MRSGSQICVLGASIRLDRPISVILCVLSDKMNCGEGFVSCVFLWVSLSCLGSMAQGSRAGTAGELSDSNFQTSMYSSFYSFCTCCEILQCKTSDTHCAEHTGRPAKWLCWKSGAADSHHMRRKQGSQLYLLSRAGDQLRGGSRVRHIHCCEKEKECANSWRRSGKCFVILRSVRGRGGGGPLFRLTCKSKSWAGCPLIGCRS